MRIINSNKFFRAGFIAQPTIPGVSTPKSGFTLVEIMVVVMIVAILVSVSALALLRAYININESIAKSTLRVIATSVGLYMIRNHACPTEEPDLLAPRSDPPYLNYAYDGQTIKGYQYSYQFFGNDFMVTAIPQACGRTGNKTFTLSQNIISETDCE